MTTPDTSTQKSNPNSRLSFHEFKKIKEDERVKKIKAKKRKPVEEVKIQIGGMEEAAGRLKKVKGRTLPLMVPTEHPSVTHPLESLSSPGLSGKNHWVGQIPTGSA